jgi:hypothetical protein
MSPQLVTIRASQVARPASDALGAEAKLCGFGFGAGAVLQCMLLGGAEAEADVGAVDAGAVLTPPDAVGVVLPLPRRASPMAITATTHSRATTATTAWVARGVLCGRCEDEPLGRLVFDMRPPYEEAGAT